MDGWMDGWEGMTLGMGIAGQTWQGSWMQAGPMACPGLLPSVHKGTCWGLWSRAELDPAGLDHSPGPLGPLPVTTHPKALASTWEGSGWKRVSPT